MAAKKYPRLGYDGGNIPKDSACKVCGATEKIRPQAVQVNWFRGDDEVYPVCKECKRSPDLLKRLMQPKKAATVAQWKPLENKSRPREDSDADKVKLGA